MFINNLLTHFDNCLSVSCRPFRRHLVTVTCLLLTGGQALSQADATFTHANFVDGERSMLELVEFPDIDFDLQVTVTCTGIATAKGRLKEAICSAPNDPDLKFTMAVSRRFNAARLIPATVNETAEEVDFQFTVVFSKEGGNETINVYANNGKNIDRLGHDYLSAQRYSPHVWPTRCGTWRREDLVLEVAIIDKTGRPRDVDIMSAEGGLNSACRTGLINQLKDGRWIPASYNGEFVDSVWVSPIVLNRLEYKRQQ